MNYIVFLIILVAAAVYGSILELHIAIQARHLFFGLHLAAFGALTSIALIQWKTQKTLKSRLFFLFLLFFIFRIAYFPVMVLSATVACYSEWLLLLFLPNCPVRVFPAFLISTVLMFAAIALSVSFALQGKRSAWFLVIILLAPMTLISLSSHQDLLLFPDQYASEIKPLPEVRFPNQNPYWDGLEDDSLNPAQKLLALAGALLYPLIPSSPWATAAKGILEHAYRSNPSGSSAERLKDHYAAFISAHRYTFSNKLSP